MQIIIKKYKKALLIDEVNKLIQSELYKYITSDKLQILGSPISMRIMLIGIKIKIFCSNMK